MSASHQAGEYRFDAPMISIRPTDVTDIEFLKGSDLAPNGAELKETLEDDKIQMAVADCISVRFLSFSPCGERSHFLSYLRFWRPTAAGSSARTW